MENKLAITIVALMVAALAAPAGMAATPVGYSANILTGQNTALTDSDGAFGNVTTGSTNNKNMTIQLKNTGNAAAKVTASGADFSDGGSNSFAIGNLKINSISVGPTGTPAQIIDSVPADNTAYDYAGELSIPSLQAGGSYTTTVNLEFANVV